MSKERPQLTTFRQCGHCKSMKPDFEKLAEEWKGHAVGLVAGVDCTEEDELCQTMQVQGFPTLMYGDPSDPEVRGV